MSAFIHNVAFDAGDPRLLGRFWSRGDGLRGGRRAGRVRAAAGTRRARRPADAVPPGGRAHARQEPGPRRPGRPVTAGRGRAPGPAGPRSPIDGSTAPTGARRTAFGGSSSGTPRATSSASGPSRRSSARSGECQREAAEHEVDVGSGGCGVLGPGEVESGLVHGADQDVGQGLDGPGGSRGRCRPGGGRR